MIKVDGQPATLNADGTTITVTGYKTGDKFMVVKMDTDGKTPVYDTTTTYVVKTTAGTSYIDLSNATLSDLVVNGEINLVPAVTVTVGNTGSDLTTTIKASKDGVAGKDISSSGSITVAKGTVLTVTAKDAGKYLSVAKGEDVTYLKVTDKALKATGTVAADADVSIKAVDTVWGGQRV